MQTVLVGGRVNGYGFDAHFLARADDPQGDLSSIRYEYFFKHSSQI